MLIDDYLSYITAVRRYSPRTQAIYREVLDRFSEFSGGAVLESLTPSLLRSYEVYLMDERKLAARTVNQHMSVLSGFCRFLMREGKLTSNPVSLVSRPKVPKRLPVYFREEQMDAYFKRTDYLLDPAFDDPKYLEDRLKRLIISILYGMAIRRAELISLRIGSFDPVRGILRVVGKGDKMREIPVIPSLCNEISLYLTSVASATGGSRPPEAPLLVTPKGRPLYPEYVDRAVKGELGGIPGRKSPHVLRHTLATELLDRGADLNSIKEMLGHSSLAATQVYTHTSVDRLKKVYDNAHPRAKTGGKHEDEREVPEI